MARRALCKPSANRRPPTHTLKGTPRWQPFKKTPAGTPAGVLDVADLLLWWRKRRQGLAAGFTSGGAARTVQVFLLLRVGRDLRARTRIAGRRVSRTGWGRGFDFSTPRRDRQNRVLARKLRWRRGQGQRLSPWQALRISFSLISLVWVDLPTAQRDLAAGVPCVNGVANHLNIVCQPKPV